MKVQKTVRGGHTSEQGDTMQALPLNQVVHGKQAVSGTSARLDMTGAKIIRLASSTDSYVKWGDDTVVATTIDVYFPAGVEVLVIPAGMTHLAIIQEASGGIVTATQLGDS